MFQLREMMGNKYLLSRRNSPKFAAILIFFILSFVSNSHSAFAALTPSATISGAPSQIGPAEFFNINVQLKNLGPDNGCGGGFALLTDNAKITGSVMGTFISRTTTFPTVQAEWYSGSLSASQTKSGTATVQAPNYKDAQSFNLNYRGWLRPATSCSGTTIYRDPSSGGTYSQKINLVPQNPQISLSGVPSEIEAGKEFTVTLLITENGWGGYNGGGVHLNVENGDIISVDSGNFGRTPVTGTLGNREYMEIYLTGSGITIPVGTTKTAYIKIKAGGSGSVKINYRGWVRDAAKAPVTGYLYRDPDDSTYPDGATADGGAKGVLEWSAKAVSVTITVPNRPPIANAGSDKTCLLNAECNFDGTKSYDPDNDTLTYSWNFGDSGAGTGATPSHTYTKVGNYTVTLTVKDIKNAAATDIALANVDTKVDLPNLRVRSENIKIK